MKHAAKLPSSRGAASSSPAASAHRLSHAIAKAPPPRKIRIIHVLAPEVIKTEARHFRELVQRLTGKPAPSGGGADSPAASTGDASSSSLPPPAPAPAASDSCDTAGDEASGAAAAAAIEAMTKVKEEPETSSSGGSSSSSGGEGGGFLRALELDGCNDAFFKELDDFLFGCCDHMESSGFDF
ncbi:hypothetical protein U9M48_034193 [Paspalum notatum var. saurae]|uniref:VQ domain-containing protein n=1 Tax=Paspalum notatum var. saurae TaxID=547442 RepID=A0AAQ3UBQ3_PASNO